MTIKAAQIGIFFDGTGNNKDADIPEGCETNIAKLFRLYNTSPYNYNNEADIQFIRKKYIRGVGSVSGSRLIGGITGAGARRRMTRAYEFIKYQLDKPEARDCDKKYIDVFGFSRGASQARHFVNMLLNLPIPVGDSTTEHHDITIRFLGIFDTVASFGIPGNELDVDFDLSVDPARVMRCVHYTAEHERRALFDLQSIKSSATQSLPQHFVETAYPGAHSDVGGGYGMTPYRASGFYKQRIINGKLVDIPAANNQYEDLQYLTDDALYAQEEEMSEEYFLPEQAEKTNELSRIPLRDMYQAITHSGIQMLKMADDPRYAASIAISSETQIFYDNYKTNGLGFDKAINSKYIHDSRYATDRISEMLPGNKLQREIYFSTPSSIVWQHAREIMAGEWDNYDEENA
ncbi:MAG: DUF2235 domain-containing protein [Gammaproteobacteria bacterium]|nr:DUF2235 domain-containing protein [Gammaproteobacteria bacterium]